MVLDIIAFDRSAQSDGPTVRRDPYRMRPEPVEGLSALRFDKLSEHPMCHDPYRMRAEPVVGLNRLRASTSAVLSLSKGSAST